MCKRGNALPGWCGPEQYFVSKHVFHPETFSFAEGKGRLGFWEEVVVLTHLDFHFFPHLSDFVFDF